MDLNTIKPKTNFYIIVSLLTLTLFFVGAINLGHTTITNGHSLVDKAYGFCGKGDYCTSSDTSNSYSGYQATQTPGGSTNFG